ncbi:MAG TPA: BMP family ABC transporter substrate-binding protein [Xanthobacteraceae bacterium]|nr:BMP family ABC transporter substrate-binding protein [Xanthobacteraceae bacterium]
MKYRFLPVAAVAAIVLAATTFHALSAEKLKVGFIGVGPVGDLGWTYQHDVGRKALVAALGDKIDTTFVENVPESADAERAIEQLARTGHKLIFTTSFGFMDPTIKVAAKFPNVHFEHATGFKRAPNVSTYAGRFYEGRYIQGQIAAKMSKTGVLGYIATFPIPEVISGINATMLGAQSVNPNIKVKIIWINTWFDPPKEADAAKALADQGADILMQHSDSPAAMQIAAQRGILAFGQDSDMIKFGPKTQLTAIIDNWGPYYIKRVQDQLDGKWKSEDTWGGLDSKMVVMAPYTNMPDDVKKMAMATQAAITNGTLHPFKCPIMAQDGTTVPCKGGTRLDNAQILSMDFYVKGIDEKVPGK